MRKLSKVLSVLMAMVLLFSSASIGVEAAYYAYKDGAITSYNVIDKPILSTEQYASMAMDEIDRMLAEANLKVDLDLAGLLSIKADFSSVDKALDSVSSVYKDIKSLLPTIGGDVKNLKWNALVNPDTGALNCPKRGTAGKTDADILRALFQFLADNAPIVAKVPYGSTPGKGLDLGLLAGFVDLGDLLDINKLAKKPVAKLVYPDKTDIDYNKTLDQYVAEMFTMVLDGSYNGTGFLKQLAKDVQKYAPGIEKQVDILNDSFYDLIDTALEIAFDAVVFDFANDYLKVALGKLCGYGYDKRTNSYGMTDYIRNPSKDDPSMKGFEGLVNTNFHLEKFDLDWDWRAGESFTDKINLIAGKVVEEAINPALRSRFTWNYADGNEALVSNVVSVAKIALTDFSDLLVSSYLEVLSPEEVNAMSDDEFVAYLLRLILNASISSSDIPDTATTTMEVLFELVLNLAKEMLPGQDYTDLEPSLDSLITMGLDMAAMGLNQITDMQLEYGLSSDDFADEAMTWVTENYGGFVSNVDGSGWEALSYVLFNIIPANWLPYAEDGSERDNLYYIIFEDIVENVLDFNLAGVLSLIGRNEDGELNGSLIEVLLGRITGIINYVFGEIFPESETYDNFEMLLDSDLLSEIIYNLLTVLNDRVDSLMPSLLPMLCSMLDLSTPAEFGYPYVSLEDVNTLNPTLTNSFYMYNASKGINTSYTKPDGTRPATNDALYKYRVKSVTTNMSDITVSPSSNITINGGTSQTFALGGNLAAHQDEVLKVTITYDVLEENGSVMTPHPLTATTYSYISDADDDGDTRIKKDATSDNMHLIYLREVKYMSTKDKLASLGDVSFDLQRNVAKKASEHSGNATIELRGANLDSSLVAAGVTAAPMNKITTTSKGGTWAYAPYVASNKEATLEAGDYVSSFNFYATETEEVPEAINFQHHVCVYDDWGLPRLLNSAIGANRQEANYGTGDFTAKYLPFYERELPEEERTQPEDYEEIEVNGADAWARYEAAVEAAVSFVYVPRQLGFFSDSSFTAQFEDLAYELYCATMELEACSVSSGAAGVKAALNAIVPFDNEVDANGNEILDEDGNTTRVEYDDARRTFFAREDYVGYTYSNFKVEKRAAERLINAEKEGELIDSVKAAYITHRLQLFGGRLIRVRAYTTYLDEAIAKYGPIYEAGKGDFNNTSWNNFERAYNFAQAVSAESIGTTYSRSENLKTEGLRQSKVNEARAQLIKTAKRLSTAEEIEEKEYVDYTQINTLLGTVKATYTAGQGNYTAVSWASFKTAYEAAVKIVADNLEKSDANQTKVNNAYTALNNAYKGLQVEQAGPEEFDVENVEFSEHDGGETLKFYVGEGEETINYIVGLYSDDPYVDGLIEAPAGYSYEIEYNDQWAESTGAYVKFIDDATGEVVMECPIVLYGDIDGNAMVDTADVVVILEALGYNPDLEWGYTYEAPDDYPYSLAADVNHDYTLDTQDVTVLLDVIASRCMLNQQWASYDYDEPIIEF